MSKGNLISSILRLFAALAGIALVALMAVTVADIVLRHLGLLAIRGIVEISTIAVVLIGFLALPNSFVIGGHIVVDLVTQFFPHRVNRRLDTFWLIFAAIAFALTAFLMWQTTLETYRQNSISLDLQLPTVWFWVPASIGMTFAPVACLLALLRNATEGATGSPPQ